MEIPGQHPFHELIYRIQQETALKDFRIANKIESFESLNSKLGSLYNSVIKSPLYYIKFWFNNEPSF